MGVGLGFPTPFANLCAMSQKTTPQSTSLPPPSVPKMVLPIVIVTRVGLSGWTIGTINSSSRRCWSTRQSLTEYPSLGSTWCINLPSWWPSIRLDNPDPPLGSRYVSRHRSAVPRAGGDLGSCRRICSAAPVATTPGPAAPSSAPMGDLAALRTSFVPSLA